MKVALFATANPEVTRSVLRVAREFFAAAEITVYLRDAYRPELEADLHGLAVASDTLRGRTFRFCRAVRNERYESLAVIFGGGRDHWKMKLMGFLAGARNLYVFNESGGLFQWSDGRPSILPNRESIPIIRKHLAWRFKETSAFNGGGHFPLPLRILVRLYALGPGPVLGVCVLIGHAIRIGVLRALRGWFKAGGVGGPR